MIPDARELHRVITANANDTLGCYDGTLVGGTAFQLGGREVSFSFDGADDYIGVPDAPLWDFGIANFRIELAGVVFREDCGDDPLHPTTGRARRTSGSSRQQPANLRSYLTAVCPAR